MQYLKHRNKSGCTMNQYLLTIIATQFLFYIPSAKLKSDIPVNTCCSHNVVLFSILRAIHFKHDIF